MEKEIKKLQTFFDDFQKDRCQNDLVSEIIESINCNVSTLIIV